MKPENEDELKKVQLMELAVINGSNSSSSGGPGGSSTGSGQSSAATLGSLGLQGLGGLNVGGLGVGLHLPAALAVAPKAQNAASVKFSNDAASFQLAARTPRPWPYHRPTVFACLSARRAGRTASCV